MKKILAIFLVTIMALTLISCKKKDDENKVDETYEVKFEVNGGGLIESIQVSKNSLITNLTKPTKANYIFGGWFSDEDLNISWKVNEHKVISNMTLYAKWFENANGPVVTFANWNGEDIIQVEKNTKLTIPKLYVKDNHTFAGWYLDQGFTNPWDFVNDIVDESITLYAKWTKANVDYNKSFKVLSIGNSFSYDAHWYLWEIAESYGIPEENILIVNMSLGGASMNQHITNIENDVRAYQYQKYTSPNISVPGDYTIPEAIVSEDWDIITFQQASHDSGLVSTYSNYVNQLTKYAKANATNENVIIGWHMTWAYQSDSTHFGFPSYQNNQINMYEKIVDATLEKVLTEDLIDFIIPSGTAIQNARTSKVGDTLTVDGYHLTHDLGRYIAGLSFFKAITGFEVSEQTIDFVPENVDLVEKNIAITAVNDAYINPFSITSYNGYEQGLWEVGKTTISHSNNHITTRIFNENHFLEGYEVLVNEGYEVLIVKFRLENGVYIAETLSDYTNSNIVLDDNFFNENQYFAFVTKIPNNETIVQGKNQGIEIVIPHKNLELAFKLGRWGVGQTDTNSTSAIDKQHAGTINQFNKDFFTENNYTKIIIEEGFQVNIVYFDYDGHGVYSVAERVSYQQGTIQINDELFKEYNYIGFNIRIFPVTGENINNILNDLPSKITFK